MKLTQNIIIAVFALIIPLVAEVATATKESVPGTGFDVLLYQPFDFAYILFVFLVLLSANIYQAKKLSIPMYKAWLTSTSTLLIWFPIAFLAVGQLHLSLGGKL